ncbi:hypothetical protein PV05_01724 [Exophiala xenobiotica]|uniref:NmrA-like domain-containing protein n=1 Tax=Exophiala xenobiotica TaxID=348802 RepID=A0A0D2FNL1_9EURO|nr:uncharacterized protein PV05_01724 [Exophiala xenobiotica]KIW61624.1 hypothetical protein PV05_01724 [Exophiala xenobiotica]
MPEDLIVITCASGQQASHLIPHLLPKYSLRLVVHSSNSHSRLSQLYPSAEVVQADLAEPAQCVPLLHGATTVYHVGPPLHPHETEIGYNMIDAAVRETARPGNTFAHFVYSSVLNPQFRKLLNHDRKRYVEEYLLESGLNFTILNPADFMDMKFPVQDWMAVENDGTPVKWPNITGHNTKSSVTALADLGEIGAKVIREREVHYQAQYPLCSTMPLKPGDVMQAASKAIARELVVDDLSVEAATNLLLTLTRGSLDKVDPRDRDGAERLILFYRRRGLQGNPGVMRWLLGREPTSVQQYLEGQMQKYREGNEKLALKTMKTDSFE